jgi:hypothetical protein
MLRWILAAICSLIVYLVVIVVGIYLTTKVMPLNGYSDQSKQFVGATWFAIATFAACLSGSLMAPRQYWKVMACLCGLGAIYWSFPPSFRNMPAVAGFSGSIIAALVSYLLMVRLTGRNVTGPGGIQQ